MVTDAQHALAKLDEQELETVLEFGQGLLELKREEERVEIIQIVGHSHIHANYPADQYQEAVEKLCELIRKRGTEKPGQSIRYQLTFEQIPISKLSEYLPETR